MRLWSLHPKYLDAKGLVALWRETLLAQKVLQGRTKGYKHHPQLERFQEHACPLEAISSYLKGVYEEAVSRGYNFQKEKICRRNHPKPASINVTKGQLTYEFNHLKEKLKVRDQKRYNVIAELKVVQPHPVFRVVPGVVADWEKKKVIIREP